jgi:hypothetical protein
MTADDELYQFVYDRVYATPVTAVFPISAEI